MEKRKLSEHEGRAREFDYAGRDRRHWQELEAILAAQGASQAEMLSRFPAYARRRDLVRFLAHYELFKPVIELPGCIVEIGVHRGASFFTWAKLLETFCPGDRSRKVFGFDHFQGLRDFDAKDGALNERAEKTPGGYGLAGEREAILRLVALHHQGNLLPGVERCRLIEGDVLETLPGFLQENPGLRISLLHLDVDLYRPTKFALEQLYPRVVMGGVVVLDEYGLMPWEGESRAVEEFCQEQGLAPVIRKFPFSAQPHGYWFKTPSSTRSEDGSSASRG
jgi:hypothetical protein